MAWRSETVEATNCGVLCHLLALTFTLPNLSTGFHLRQAVGEMGVDAWDEGDSRLIMAPFIRSLSAFDPARLETVQREYIRLFGLGLAQHDVPCPPGECAYRSEIAPDLLACQLQETYAAWGIDVPLALACRVETELEFLAFLCRHEDEKGVKQAKQEFLNQHARRWLLDFAGRVASHTQLLCYRTAANLLTAFLKTTCPQANQPAWTIYENPEVSR